MREIIAIAAGVIFAVGIIIGALTLAAFTILWNTEDIVQNGANFWNIFWLVATGAGILAVAGTSAAGR